MTGPRKPSRDNADDDSITCRRPGLDSTTGQAAGEADAAGEVVEFGCLGPFDYPEYFDHDAHDDHDARDVREDADEDEGWTLW